MNIRHIKNLIRLIGKMPKSGYPTDARTSDVVKILRQSAATLTKDVRKFALRHPPSTYTGSFFNYNRKLAEQITGTLGRLHYEINSSVENAIASEWQLANDKYDELVKRYSKSVKLSSTVASSMHQLNYDAMNAFIARRDGGMNLSERVWDFTVKGNQEKLELYLASGVTVGRSANAISRDVRELLIEPNKLFRRIRDPKTGKLVLSQAAKAYHPGRGVYRSSYKNALRLAATETNMAYRLSDSMRRKQLPFVLGITIHLSNAHPILDICDDMAGDYPKGYIFTGWHPFCMCYTTTRLATIDEFKDYMRGGDLDPSLFTREIPLVAREYLLAKKPALERLKNRPYFLRDNFTKKYELKKSVLETVPELPKEDPMQKLVDAVNALEVTDGKVAHGISKEIADKKIYTEHELFRKAQREMKKLNKVDTFKIDDLIATRESIDKETLLEIIKHYDPKLLREPHLPLVVRVDGKYYLSQGHSRVSALKKLGQETVDARFIDIDTTKPSKIKKKVFIDKELEIRPSYPTINTRQIKTVEQALEKQIEVEARYGRHVTVDELKEELNDHMRNLVEKAELNIRIPEDKVDVILKDARLKSQFEANDSRGCFSPKLRADVEKKLFGAPIDLEVKERPIYGYMSKPYDGSRYLAEHYGDVVIKMNRKAVERRTTFVLEDSLATGDTSIPVKLTEPTYHAKKSWQSIEDFLKSNTLREASSSYAEFQIHGGVELNAINVEKIVFPKYYRISQTLEDRMRELGIKWEQADDYVKRY